MGRAKDRTGFRRAKMVVLRPVDPDRKYGSKTPVLWWCKCDCGTEFMVPAKRLVDTHAPMSCGCATYAFIAAGSEKRRHPRRASLNLQYTTHKTNAKNRGYFPLSREEWEKIVFLPCRYCGEIDNRGRQKSRAANNKYSKFTVEEEAAYTVAVNGVDRIDSQRGYEIDNCAPCCSMCNSMKNGYTEADFFQRVKRVYECHNLHSLNKQPVGFTPFSEMH